MRGRGGGAKLCHRMQEPKKAPEKLAKILCKYRANIWRKLSDIELCCITEHNSKAYFSD